MSGIQNISPTHVVQQGLYWGAVSALYAGSAAYLQNRFDVVSFFKRFDSSYVAPSFTTALSLGAPVLGIELLTRPIEMLTRPEVPELRTEKKVFWNPGTSETETRQVYTDYEGDLKLFLPAYRKALAHQVLMTAAKTYLFIKGAEAIARGGWPIHRGFIYQVAYIYALNSFNFESSQTALAHGLFSIGFGALVVGGTWASYKIGFEGLLQRMIKDYVTPPYSQVFKWITASIFLDFGAELVSDRMIMAGFGPQATASKTAKIAKLILAASIQYGMAQLLKRYGFSFSDGYINFSLAMLGGSVGSILSSKK